jgi:hypothetical protein
MTLKTIAIPEKAGIQLALLQTRLVADVFLKGIRNSRGDPKIRFL